MDDLDSFQDHNWDLPDFDCFVNDVSPCSDPLLGHHSLSSRSSSALDTSQHGATSQENEYLQSECPRKRRHMDLCCKPGSKACREKVRRQNLNERFAELCSVLQPDKPAKTDKMAILGDAIRVINQLKADSQEYSEMNEKLLEEIKSLKADKNELREEKMKLKADKESLKQQMKGMSFLPSHPAVYQHSFGYLPMWHYLTPPAGDPSQDHKFWPPAG